VEAEKNTKSVMGNKFEDFRSHEAENEKRDQEELFQSYFYDLALSPEDFGKLILDVGGGRGGFASWAREHNLSDDIYTLDPELKTDEKNKLFAGRVEELPFQNEVFDLVVSHASIPQLFSGGRYEELDKKQLVESAVNEMLRVLRTEGEIRLAPLSRGEIQNWHRPVWEVLRTVLDKLQEDGLITSEEETLGKAPTRFNKNGEAIEGSEEEKILIKIKKMHGK